MNEPAPQLFERLPEPYFANLVRDVMQAQRDRPGGVIDLARGSPDRAPSERILETLAGCVTDPAMHGYPGFAGEPQLRQAVADWYARRYGVRIDEARQVAVVPGVKTGLVLLAMAVSGPGDTVAVPDPGYPDLPPAIAAAGSSPVPLLLDPGAGWAPAWESLPRASTRSSTLRMVYLNYPSNPTGACVPPSVFDEAVIQAERRGALLVHDLAYGDLAYGANDLELSPAPSLLAAAGSERNCVELVTMSKGWAMAGWRIGFIVGCEQTIDRVKQLLVQFTVGVFRPLQVVAAHAIASCDDDVRAIRNDLARRSARLAQVIDIERSKGGYYSWWRLPRGHSIASVRDQLGVACAGGSGFGESGRDWARVSVSVSDELFDEACLRLARL